MCGFFGYVAISGQQESHILMEATEILDRRGPDDAGTWSEERAGLAHCRLSIFDLSDRASQPMIKWHKTLVFNGAIYNFPELRAELSTEYDFSTNSDTEVVLAAYDKWGTECVQRFNGQWAFCIVDHRTGDLFASRDRFGIKPFYWLEFEGVLYFSSEFRCFALVPGFKLQPSVDYITSYLSPSGGKEICPYEDIKSLGPGTNLSFKNHDQSKEVIPYYSLPALEPLAQNFAESRDQFRSLLVDAVKLRMRGDVQVCSTLSGGIDSNSIASIATQLSDKLSTYSIIFDHPKGTEGEEIRRSTEFFGREHKLINDDPKGLVEKLDTVTQQQEVPLASMSVLAQWSLYRSIKGDDFKIALDGQGADEYLMGYDSFLKAFPTNLAWYPRLVLKYLSKKHSGGFVVRSDGQKRLDGSDPVSDALQHVLPALLHTLDRNSAGSGVECRLPFLDHRLVEFTRSLPTSFLLRRGVRKRILWDAMKDQIPSYLKARRTKKAFLTPQSYWVKQHKEFLENEVLSHRALISNFIQMDDFKFGAHSSHDQWRLFTLVRWLKQWK